MASVPDLISPDFDKVFYEAEIMVQKPGGGYLRRWAQLNKREFRYYQSMYKSAQWLALPLYKTSLENIEGIKVIEDSNSPLHNKLFKGHYAFALILKGLESTTRKAGERTPQCKPSGKFQPPHQWATELRSAQTSRKSSQLDVAHEGLSGKKLARSKSRELVFKKTLVGTKGGALVRSMSRKSVNTSRKDSSAALSAEELGLAAEKREGLDKWTLVLSWMLELNAEVRM